MEPLLDRFCRYVRIDTQADEAATSYPSTPGQLELGRLLAQELQAMGVRDAAQDRPRDMGQRSLFAMNRRTFIKTTAGAAALMAMTRRAYPFYQSPTTIPWWGTPFRGVGPTHC